MVTCESAHKIETEVHEEVRSKYRTLTNLDIGKYYCIMQASLAVNDTNLTLDNLRSFYYVPSQRFRSALLGSFHGRYG